MGLRTLIVDDEAQARKRIGRLLAAIEDVEVVGELADGDAMLRRLESTDQEIELLILDINMPGLSGLDLAALLPDPRPAIIYVTAHQDHALAAYDRGAIDYVLKPVDPARLRKAVERVRAIHRRGRSGPADASARLAGLDRLAVETQRGLVLVDPETITHICLEDGLVRIYLLPVTGQTCGQTLLSTRRLQDLEARLGADSFLRVHRQAIVNLAHVRTLEPLQSGGYRAHVTGGNEVLVSRQVARSLRRLL